MARIKQHPCLRSLCSIREKKGVYAATPVAAPEILIRSDLKISNHSSRVNINKELIVRHLISAHGNHKPSAQPFH